MIEGIIPAMDRKTLAGRLPREDRGLAPSENVPLRPCQFRYRRARGPFSRPGRRTSSRRPFPSRPPREYPFYVIGGGNQSPFRRRRLQGAHPPQPPRGPSSVKPRLRVLSGTGLPASPGGPRAGLSGLEFLPGSRDRRGAHLRQRRRLRLEHRRRPRIRRPVRSPVRRAPGGPRESLASATGFALKKGGGSSVLSTVLMCSPGDSRESEAGIAEISIKAGQAPALGDVPARSYFK